MAKKEFNDNSRNLKDFYEILGVEPPVLSAEERKELQGILDGLKEARAKDPDFDRKAIEAWAKAEAAANPDDYDDLTARDMRRMLKNAVRGPK